jgi:8-oxo-dGTP pyrophosphatase MutT (NUDIX family)
MLPRIATLVDFAMSDYIIEIRKLIGHRPLVNCGAAVLLIDDAERLLLHHRTDNGAWGLPGGTLEPGESLAETAKRETREEVGLICHTLEFFNIYSGPRFYYRYPNGDENYNVTVVYLCRDFQGTMRVNPDEGKEACFFNIGEFPSPIAAPIQPVLEDFCRHYHELHSSSH